MATLDRTVQGLTAAEIPASRSDVQGLLDRLQSLTEAGVLESATGHPPVEIARLILTSLRSDAEGDASANSQSLGTLQPHSA
jgi:hypothetical protein